jgi:site-specific recombinase XerD
VHLTPFELEKLERATFTPEQSHLQMARDAFLFCCYTGLRYSDFVRLAETNIQRGVMHTWVSFECHKTGAQVRLPVDMLFGGKALRLLDRYDDNLSALFHLHNNSVVDKQLLTVARHAGVRKHFSFHSARHTNATLLLAQGVSVTTVQKLLGHKNVRTTMGYCDVIDRTIINELRRVAGNGK